MNFVGVCCNVLKPTINVLRRSRAERFFHLTFQGKFSARCEANFGSCLRHNDFRQFKTSFRKKKIIFSRQPLPRSAMAMEKMEISDEQIFEEKQRIEQEETFLGKEELPEVAEASSDEAGPKIGAVGSELRECWDLWQRIGLSVEKIAKERNMTETGVFYCIFICIQNNYTVDWYELCKAAQFTLDIANRMIQATEKFVASTSGGPIDSSNLRQHLPADVSEVHFGLYVTMLSRGLPFETIKDISFQTGGRKPEMEWGEEYADEERFPKEVTENRLLQWFAEKDGASMIEIALKFRECDDLELMRLILKLDEKGKVFWRNGIFRVM